MELLYQMWRVCIDTFICNKSNLPLETSQWGQMCVLLMQMIGLTCMNHSAKCTLHVWVVVWKQVNFAER